MVGETLLRREDLCLSGIVDPTCNRSFEAWRAHADVIMIGAEELLDLSETDSAAFDALSKMQVIVLVEERRLLDVLGRFGRQFAFVLVDEGEEGDAVFSERVALALDGYCAITNRMMRRLTGNELRLDLVARFSPNERRVLALIGQALPNRRIAAETGLVDGQVKVLVRNIARKLRMKNRTEVAVFAASQQLDVS